MQLNKYVQKVHQSLVHFLQRFCYFFTLSTQAWCYAVVCKLL